MNEILERIEKTGIVPVVVLEDAEKAVPVAKALQAGGIDCAEVTFRTAAAEEAIGRIAAECPSILLGAGTVLSVDMVKKAVDAGAKFIVTPVSIHPSFLTAWSIRFRWYRAVWIPTPLRWRWKWDWIP